MSDDRKYVHKQQTSRTSRVRTPVNRIYIYYVEMAPNRVIGEMVLDGGGHFIPAGIFGFHTLSLLLTSLVAHDRAKEATRTHTGKEHQSTNTRDTLYY